MRKDAPRDDKVSIVQGSGSGHEPAHVMIVGKGMLDAACPGDVFAAPPMDYVTRRPRSSRSPKGVLLLVNNYTGDRMAFDMGKEMAESEGVRTEILMINDDVAVKDSTYTIGRRGVAGNFFVIKAVGAASERGDELEEVVRIGKKVNDVTRTMGVALTACTPPAKGSPLFDLGADEMEVGVGIHGEPGRERRKLAGRRHRRRAARCRRHRPALRSGDRVALMVNGLGGTPISELYILYRRAHKQLADRGITVGRSYVNEYCTSLDMAGASITLVKLDDEIEELLAAPAEVADPRLLTPSGRRRSADRRRSRQRCRLSSTVRRSPPFLKITRTSHQVVRPRADDPDMAVSQPGSAAGGALDAPGGLSPCFRSNPTPTVSWTPSARASLPEIPSPDCSPAGSPRRPAPSCASRAGARPA